MIPLHGTTTAMTQLNCKLRKTTSAFIAGVILLAACGSDSARSGVSVIPTTSETGDTPTTVQHSTSAATTAPPASTTSASTTTTIAADERLAATITQVLTAGMADATNWSCCGAAATPTAALAGVRAPGRPDVIAATGVNVDGAPIDRTTPFNTGSLASSISRSIAYQLIDAGKLDATASLDRWVPTMPNAAQITVQMLFDDLTGWAEDRTLLNQYVLPDLAREWTPEEVIAAISKVSPEGPPGTPGDELDMLVMPYVLEQATGMPYSKLVAEYVTEPLGLAGTNVAVDAIGSPDYLQGVFAFDNKRMDTTQLPTTAFFSFYRGLNTSTSTIADLLDLLDAWADGTLLGSDRSATAEHFAVPTAGLNGVESVAGTGTPLNTYCPCAAETQGVTGVAIGRRPDTVGSTTYMLRYQDGIDVVVHFNSNDWPSKDVVRHIADQIHEAAVPSMTS